MDLAGLAIRSVGRTVHSSAAASGNRELWQRHLADCASTQWLLWAACTPRRPCGGKL